jgi:hypothetical protein
VIFTFTGRMLLAFSEDTCPNFGPKSEDLMAGMPLTSNAG